MTIEPLNITKIVEDIVFELSPSYMVDPLSLKKWYCKNGINLIMMRTGLKTICYNVDNFDWKDISNKKKVLILNQNQLEIEQKQHYENIQR